jgi:DNA-binding response OmpR family regulator
MSDPLANDAADQARLLIVDDDAASILIISKALGAYPNQCFASTGAEAIDSCRTFKPDVVLLDFVMPDISGIAICEQLRRGASRDELPIIFVTSHAHMSVAIQTLRTGANDFLAKPVNPWELRTAVAKILRQKREADHQRNRMARAIERAEHIDDPAIASEEGR